MITPWSPEEKDFYQIATRRIDRSHLMPEFRLLMRDAWLLAFRAGHNYFATSGYRDFQEQNRLYQQGRIKPGKIVTYAKGGESAHNYGLAVDWCYSTTGLVDPTPSWDVAKYAVLAKSAKECGLEAGYFWRDRKDAPHIQVPYFIGRVNIKTLPPQRLDAWNEVRKVWPIVGP